MASETAKPDTPATAPPVTSAESKDVQAAALPTPSSPPPPLRTPTAQKLGGGSSALLKVKRPFREVVEQYLRENGIPYVNVDEAKKVLFGGAKLRTFHFVVYRTPQTNWLLHVAQLRKETREDLKQWEDIFGGGFMAVIAKQAADGTQKFKTLKGEEVQIR